VLSPRLAKLLVSVSSAIPAFDLIRVLYQHDHHFLAAYDFPAFDLAISVSGRWAFAFLFLVLACTPLQRIVRSSWVPAVRRPLGLAAFGYGVLHFLVYFLMGQKGNVEYVVEDAMRVSSRWSGWLSLLLLLPLALTSTDGMVRRLGGKRWKLLHRLVYPATAAAIWHAYRVATEHSLDYTLTETTAIVFGVLMLMRLIRFRRGRTSDATESVTPRTNE
jgi:sulfoxide reductase heme-binding subunit YedZ